VSENLSPNKGERILSKKHSADPGQRWETPYLEKKGPEVYRKRGPCTKSFKSVREGKYWRTSPKIQRSQFKQEGGGNDVKKGILKPNRRAQEIHPKKKKNH